MPRSASCSCSSCRGTDFFPALCFINAIRPFFLSGTRPRFLSCASRGSLRNSTILFSFTKAAVGFLFELINYRCGLVFALARYLQIKCKVRSGWKANRSRCRRKPRLFYQQFLGTHPPAAIDMRRLCRSVPLQRRELLSSSAAIINVSNSRWKCVRCSRRRTNISRPERTRFR